MKGRERQGYNYQYGSYDRLTRATYFDIHDDGSLEMDNKYGEFVRYDRRGNIKVLERRGMLQAAVTNSNQLAGIFGTIDLLNYNYRDNNPNQLRLVSDGADAAKGYVKRNDLSYEYDLNGNLTKDPQKEILYIHYNYLNLPVEIMFTDRRVIQFLYDASGQKLRKTVAQLPDDSGTLQMVFTTARDYFGGIEYQDGVLDLVHHGSGGVTRNDKKGEFEYFYALRDHLGNTRVTFMDLDNSGTVDASTEIIQINHYYAFGMNMEGNWNGAEGKLKYQFTGKEWNDDFGLGWNDYGARFYDPALGRWHSVDPLAELAVDKTPYHYCSNDPVNRVDPDGMRDKDGKRDRTYEYEGEKKVPLKNPFLTEEEMLAITNSTTPDPDPKPYSETDDGWKKAPGPNTNFVFKGESPKYLVALAGYQGTGMVVGAGAPSGGSSVERANALVRIPIYYTDDTDGRLSQADIKVIIGHAKRIFDRNGIGQYLEFIPISASEARKHWDSKPNEGFLAFTYSSMGEPGSSHPNPDASVGVYHQDWKSWSSWVNYREANGQSDKLYYCGYIMAHEILHQLLNMANVVFSAKLFEHDNSSRNLNMQGDTNPNNPYADPRHLGSPIKGSKDELILPHQKEFLMHFFNKIQN